MATDEKEDEKHERVATALENMILLQGMGVLCALGRYIGIEAEELHEMFDAVTDAVDAVIDEAENHECEKPKLKVVKDKPDKH